MTLLVNYIDSLRLRIEAVIAAKDPEAKATAYRRLANAASDIETEAARLADESEDERCAAWDLEHGYATGSRPTRINPPEDIAAELFAVSMESRA